MKYLSLAITTLRPGKRLMTCVAGAAALLMPALTPAAKASIVYSGAINTAVPQTDDGIYVNLATGTAGGFSFGYTINPFYSGGRDAIAFFPGDGTTYVAATTGNSAGAAPSALSLGAFIGSTDVFSTSTYGTNFEGTGTGYLGLSFVNSVTGATDYGWIQFSTTAANGFPASILGYAYEDTGASLLAGQTTNAVPEPTTTAALALGAVGLGLVGLRARRRNQQAI